MGYVVPVREAGSYFREIIFERVAPDIGIDLDVYRSPLEHLTDSLSKRFHIDDLVSPIMSKRFSEVVNAAVKEFNSRSFIPFNERDPEIRRADCEFFSRAADTAIIMVSFFRRNKRYNRQDEFYGEFGKANYDIAMGFAPPDEAFVFEALRDNFWRLAGYLERMKREIGNDRYMIH